MSDRSRSRSRSVEQLELPLAQATLVELHARAARAGLTRDFTVEWKMWVATWCKPGSLSPYDVDEIRAELVAALRPEPSIRHVLGDVGSRRAMLVRVGPSGLREIERALEARLREQREARTRQRGVRPVLELVRGAR
jgi:hypothetical protein